MFRSRYMPCHVCGASVDRTALREHECSSERRTDYELFGLRGEIAQLEAGMLRYLGTAAGRFETWLAAHHVRGRS